MSIITPSFNQGHFIEETIRSIIEQKYSNLEYIIMDGGSTDNTLSIISKYEKYLTAWESVKDNGQSDAINKGLSKCTGDIVNWLNSDDYYETDALYHISKKMVDPKITCYIGKSRIFNNQSERFSNGTDIYIDNLFKTIGWARIDQPETFFKHSVFKEIGYINESLHFVMDKDLWIRYLSKYGMEGIEKDNHLLVHFRLHGSSKTVSLYNKFEEETRSLFYTYAIYFKQDDYCRLFEKLWDVKKLPLTYYPFPFKEGDWDKVFNYFILQQGLQEYAFNNYKAAKQILSVVKINLLFSNDKEELNKVQRRLKYLPKSLKRILNLISNNFHLIL